MAKRGQNEGSIFQRKDRRWVAALNLGWVNGKRVRKSFYGDTRKQVQEQLTKALADIQKGLPVLNKEQTVSDYLNWWLEEVAKRTVRPSTYDSYCQIVRLYLGTKSAGSWQPDAGLRAGYDQRKKEGKLRAGENAPAVRAQRFAIGSYKLSQLTAPNVRSLLNEMHDFGLSARTVQYTHAILRRALGTALKDDMIARNVAALVQPPRGMVKEVQPLTPDEARRFLKAVEGNRLEALFTVAVSLGLRQGEALAIRWQDVDLEAGNLRVRYALQRLAAPKNGTDCVDGTSLQEGRNPIDSIHEVLQSDSRAARKRHLEIHLVEPKTRRSRRTIDLPQVTLSALASHQIRQAEERRSSGSRWTVPVVHCEGRLELVDDLVFTSAIGTPLEKCNVNKQYQRILKFAGIPRHRFHDLRHTAATLLAVQGVHAKAIQAVLGWDQLSMVDRYTHFVDEMRKEAAIKMDAILNPVAVKVAVKHVDPKAN